MIHVSNCAVIALDEEGIDVPRAENLEIKLKLCGKRANATYQDLIPTASDNECINQAFISLIAEMIARYTPGSNAWEEQGEMLSEIHKTMGGKNICEEKNDGDLCSSHSCFLNVISDF